MNFKKRVNGSWTDIPYYVHNTSTDTITTLPAVLYPTGTTATVGLEGNMEQSSTPTPTTPIQPSECGERTANLCTGYTTPNSQFNIYIENFKTIIDTVRSFTLSFDSGLTYAGNTLYLITDGGNIVVGYVAGKGHVVKPFSFDNTQVEAIKSSNNPYIRLYVNGADMSGNTNVMLNSGSTNLPYEPYGYKIPISSANTTTPVYLGGVETTRKIKKVVFTGSADETWNRAGSTHGYFTDLPNEARTSGATDIISSHYAPTMSSADGTVRIGNSKTEVLIYDNYTSVTDFKAYLAQQYAAGTPVTVWYVLATEETGIVNEPLRKIGDYADTVSGISIPVTAGGDTISVDTTVQPSEITANYKGWHPKTPKVSNNGQWS